MSSSRTLLISVLLTLACSLHAAGATATADTLTIRSLFSTLKVPELDLLDSSTRLDMLDYAEAGQPYTAHNSYYGESRITSLTDSALSVYLTQVSRAQLFLLPSRKGMLAGLIYTIDSEGTDSQLNLFDSALQPLKTEKYFKAPVITDFLLPSLRSDKQARATLQEEVPFTALTYVYAPDSRTLTVHLSLESIVSREGMKRLQPLLCKPGTETPDPLVYEWNGSRFVLKQPL